jgi:hypothetical protein
MPHDWEAPFEAAINEIASVRRDLGSFDSRALSVLGSERESLLRARASTHIWLAAIVERFVAEWLQAICSEFNTMKLSWVDVRLSLLSVGCGAELQAIADGVRKDAWGRRVSIFDRAVDTNSAMLSFDFVPLDGKTIRPSHLDDIWKVFGFRSQVFPHAMHRFVLTTIADKRNEIAHGRIRPAQAGASFTYGDYERHISRVEDIVEHLIISTEDYFAKSHYLR